MFEKALFRNKYCMVGFLLDTLKYSILWTYSPGIPFKIDLKKIRQVGQQLR